MSYADSDMQRVAKLSDIVSPDVPRASSLLLSAEGRFLLGVRPPVHDRGKVLLRLTGIGGWAEGDEHPADTAARECLEETGCQVRMFDIDQTKIVHSPDDIRRVYIEETPAPAAVVFRRFGISPFDIWSPTYGSVAPVSVFVGTLDGMEPRIEHPNELPFFMYVYPEQLIMMADSDEALEYLLESGAELVGEPTFDTRQAVARLTDSIQALIAAMGPRSYQFLFNIARRTQQTRAE